MRLPKLGKARQAVATVAAAVLVAALGYGVSSVLVTHVMPQFSLTATKGFAISGQIYATTCTTTPGALLYPGTERCLVVTVTNPYGAPLSGTITMTVTSFTPASTASGPHTCTVTTATPTTFTVTFTAPPGTHVAITHPFELKTNGQTQNKCQAGTFVLTYQGLAHVTYAAACETVSVTPNTVTTKTGTLGHLDVSGGTVFLAQTAHVKGNVTVAASGVLVSTGATITGNVTSAGGQVALEAETIVGKNVTANGGKLAIGTTTKVSGTVTATGTQALCIDGASATTMVTIGGAVTVKHMPGGTLASICAANLDANLTERTSGATATIGHKTSLTLPTGSLCAGGSAVTGSLVVTANFGPVSVVNNTVVGNTHPNTGNLTVISNTAGVTVDTNLVARNTTVSLNAGGTLLTNTVTGNCNLKSNTPVVHGTGNTVHGTVTTCNGTH